MPHGIMFHHFFDGKHYKGPGAISVEVLSQMIEYLGRDRILNASEWMYRARQGKLKIDDICLTFDDTLLCQYDIALPVLKRYSLTAFWFVNSSVITGEIGMLEVYRKFRCVMFSDVEDFFDKFFLTIDNSRYARLVQKALINFKPESYLVDFPFYTAAGRKFRYIRDRVLGPTRYGELMNGMLKDYDIDIKKFSANLWLNKDQLKNLHSMGHIIGLHSHSHPMLMEQLSFNKQKREYQTNFKILYDITGKKPNTMSHPCNSYSRTTLSILKDLGITVGFRANMKLKNPSGLEFAREDHMNIIRQMKT